MFKYCVWYVLKDKHIIHQQIKRYSQVFNTEPFTAHITIRHSLGKEEALELYKSHVSKNESFSPIGRPVITCYIKNNKQFYSIEQPLTNGLHISLAYRLNGGFHPVELAIVGKINTIKINEVRVCIADCSSYRPKEWEILSI
jgi:hypothetical protein